MSLDILYEDNHLIAINKKPGDIVQGDKTGDTPLSDHVKEYIKKKYDKPGNVYLGVIHRLDRPTSGIVLFAKTGKALTRMNDLFRQRKIEKTYWAVTGNKPESPEGRLVHYLLKNPKNNKATTFIKETEGAKKAITSYKLAATSDKYYLLEVDIETGRHHQIRAQLAAIGCPIKGDLKYGAPRSNKDASIHLHARALQFEHPVKQEPVNIVARPPSDTIWDFFVRKFE